MKVIPIYCNCGITSFESPAAEYSEMSLSLDDLLIKNPTASFIGLAAGFSMTGVGIFDGDLLIVDRSREVKDGSIIVANYNGSFICKILDKTNNRLLSASKDHPPVIIGEGDVFQLEGSVPVSVRKHDETFNLSAFL
jgi:DNA polymerase V